MMITSYEAIVAHMCYKTIQKVLAGSDEALISKGKCTALETLFTFCPAAPWGRMAFSSISSSEMETFAVISKMFFLATLSFQKHICID